MNKKSIKVRYLTSLVANVFKLGLSFLSGLIIARGLGPEGYGNFNFLLGSSVSISTLLNMGTSSAFYTFISQKKRGVSFYIYYIVWLAIQFVVVAFLIYLIFPDSWINKIWLHHNKGIILLAFIASFMTSKVWQTVTEIGESIRETVIVQLHNVILAAVHLCIVSGILLLQRITLENLFLIIIFENLFFAVILAKRLKIYLDDENVSRRLYIRDTINEYKNYCMPLVYYGVVSFIYSFADLWLLQNFGGAKEQGFYSIGLRFSALSLIATTSMMKVFWKEIAEATEIQDKKKIKRLYTTTIRRLYFVGAAMSCFLIPYSREILRLVLGPAFENAWPCLSIMFLYPIHQSSGQVCGSFFCAAAHTKVFSTLGIIFMLISVPVSYLMIAPSTVLVGGLGLGSIGLALKMVILQVISVNTNIYVISRMYGWQFDFGYQVVCVGLLLACSFIIKKILFWFFSGLANNLLIIFSMCSGLIIYLFAVLAILYLFPWLINTTRSNLLEVAGEARKIFRLN